MADKSWSFKKIYLGPEKRIKLIVWRLKKTEKKKTEKLKVWKSIRVKLLRIVLIRTKIQIRLLTISC